MEKPSYIIRNPRKYWITSRSSAKEMIKVYQELVDVFNEGTNYGSDMQDYSDLLREAIDIIRGKKEELGLASLFSAGGTTLQTELLNNPRGR